MPVPLRRAVIKDTAQRPIRLAALRAPLLVKVVGANLLSISIAAMLWSALTSGGLVVAHSLVLGAVLSVALVATVHFALVVIALHPVRDLEAVAARVWAGDYGARVEGSAVADHDVLRVGAMFNLLLDGLKEDRAR